MYSIDLYGPLDQQRADIRQILQQAQNVRSISPNEYVTTRGGKAYIGTGQLHAVTALAAWGWDAAHANCNPV